MLEMFLRTNSSYVEVQVTTLSFVGMTWTQTSSKFETQQATGDILTQAYWEGSMVSCRRKFLLNRL